MAMCPTCCGYGFLEPINPWDEVVECFDCKGDGKAEEAPLVSPYLYANDDGDPHYLPAPSYH